MSTKKLILLFVLGMTLSLTGCGRTIDPEWLENKYAQSPHDFIMVGEQRVHYRDQGTGEVIVLLHGTAASLHTWDAWTTQLSRHYRIIRMDLPGFGLTGPSPHNRYQVSDDLVFLKAFLDRLQLDQVHLVGSSLGGRIAWEYSLHHPQQVRSLTLINALGYPQEAWPLPIQLGQLPVFDTLMSRFQPRFVFTHSLQDLYFDPGQVTPELVDRYYELSLFPGNRAAFPMRVKARLDQDSARISQITQPTLILWGQADRYFPLTAAYRFADDIPNATLRVYARAGHLPMEELPEQSAGDFMSFLRNL